MRISEKMQRPMKFSGDISVANEKWIRLFNQWEYQKKWNNQWNSLQLSVSVANKIGQEKI